MPNLETNKRAARIQHKQNVAKQTKKCSCCIGRNGKYRCNRQTQKSWKNYRFTQFSKK